MFTKKAIALGTFDGLHTGHRSVLVFAKTYDLTVLTFRYPPKSVKNSKKELIMLPQDKENALLKLGAKSVVFLDFQQVKDISAEDFLNYLKETYNPDLICCGFDFRFGKNASGNTSTIEKFCNQNNMECMVAPPVLKNGKPISST
ncbi:MAG: hypothetical protein IJT84_00745, partial [Clostridia bacterium]|nr:hypothetical protein [Clostridia bacterium]